jgi:hypothetical protein
MIRLADVSFVAVRHELAPSVWVETAPLTPFRRAVAMAGARRRLAGLREGIAALQDDLAALAPFGLADGAVPEFDDPDIEAGAFEVLVLEETLTRSIQAWGGIEDEGGAAASVNAETVRQFCRVAPAQAERIYRRLLADDALRSVAGNGYGPSGAGGGQAGPTIATDAAG